MRDVEKLLDESVPGAVAPAASMTARRPSAIRSSNARKDKAHLHATNRGFLTRPLYESLARRNENIRQLRKLERELRNDLGPEGAAEELLFDRMWSSHLRCLLLVRSEARLLTRDKAPAPVEIDFPGLPKSEFQFSFDDLSFTHLQNLALTQRYDAHFSRDFFRSMGLLIAIRDARRGKLTRQPEKDLIQTKNEPTE